MHVLGIELKSSCLLSELGSQWVRLWRLPHLPHRLLFYFRLPLQPEISHTEYVWEMVDGSRSPLVYEMRESALGMWCAEAQGSGRRTVVGCVRRGLWV